MVKPEMWNDQYEGYIGRFIDTAEGKEKISIYLKENHSASEENIAHMQDFIRLLCENTYCLCFSADIDAEVMWNAYSYNSQAIMIITTDDELEKLNTPPSYDFEIRKVQYDLEDTGIMSICSLLGINGKNVYVNSAHKFFTHKRKCFEYEKEYRIIVMSTKYKGSKFARYPIEDLSTFIKGVMVHPLATESYDGLVKRMCEKFNLKYLGKSKIYSFDNIY